VLRKVDAVQGHTVACHFHEQIQAPQSIIKAEAVNERLLRLQQAFSTSSPASVPA
jgi:hypothetical protein